MPAEHKPTDETRSTVEALASFGIPQEDIAAQIQVAPKSLRKHYSEEINRGIAKTNAKVGQFLAKHATGIAMQDKDNPASRQQCLTAAIFWSKCRMGFNENVKPKSMLNGLLADYDD